MCRIERDPVGRTCVLQVRGSSQAEPQTSKTEVCATPTPLALHEMQTAPRALFFKSADGRQ
jgi:hypothetical protein